MSERDSEGHEAVVSDSKVWQADEVSEVEFVGENDDELGEVSEVDYDVLKEVSEDGEANEWWAGWGLLGWRGWWG